MNPKTNQAKLRHDPLRDEFPTSKELAQEIVDHLAGKVDGKSIYCNCDTPHSEIYQHIKARFKELGLKYLVATSYCKDGHGVKTTFDGVVESQQPTAQDGSFDSPESLAIMQQSDVIVTNPPFSAIVRFINVITNSDKEFLIVVPKLLIASVGAILKGNMSKLLDGTLCMMHPKNSGLKHKYDERFATVELLSTFPLPIPTIIPTKSISEVMESGKAHYTDNYPDILCIDALKYIPCDYNGRIALPITAVQVRIKGWKSVKLMQATTKKHDGTGLLTQRCIVNGKAKFSRVMMKKED